MVYDDATGRWGCAWVPRSRSETWPNGVSRPPGLVREGAGYELHNDLWRFLSYEVGDEAATWLCDRADARTSTREEATELATAYLTLAQVTVASTLPRPGTRGGARDKMLSVLLSEEEGCEMFFHAWVEGHGGIYFEPHPPPTDRRALEAR